MRSILRLGIVAIVLLALIIPSSVFARPTNDESQVNASSGQILVKFREGITSAEIASINRLNGGKTKDIIPEIGVQVITVSGRATEKARAYASNPKVQFAEPDYLAAADSNPDDPWFASQWGLNKIQAPLAWDITTGSSSVCIAILDTGVELNHPDLAGKIVASKNFTTSSTANDVGGHGTHVAGIAAAITNNKVGVAGLGYNSTIMNVKVLGDDGYGSYSWIAQGIIWATDNGAKVINMSLGGTSASSTLESAVNYAWNKGVVVVAAAGNEGTSAPCYPAYYTKTIAVAATDSNDKVTSWSNYGSWVDVAAPGVAIYSTLKGNNYGFGSGTSMATPFVSGLAALVFTRVTDINSNNLLNDEVRAQIEKTCDDIGATGISGGRINALKSVQTNTTIVTTGVVVGKVIDSTTGNAILGVTVTDGVRSVTTDAGGYYRIDNMVAGNYTLMSSAQDYVTGSKAVTVVAAQTVNADFTLTKVETPAPTIPTVQSLWVNNLNLGMTGKNLRLDIKVTGEKGAIAGAQVNATIAGNDGQTWIFSGVTDSSGVVSFTLLKPADGSYVARVTGVSATGYIWDTAQGLTETSYTPQTTTKPPKK